MADSLITFLFTILLFSLTKPITSHQQYDHTSCNTTIPLLTASTYTCNSVTKTCNTFIVYRPQFNQTLSAIATLFNVNESQLNSTSHFQDREVIVPIICNCPDWSSRFIINYTNVNSYSFPDIACGVYQGLVKPFVLEQQNGNHHETPLVIRVPVKCACVNTSNETNGTRYLVTYPIMEKDTIDMIAMKFGVSVGSIQEANGMDPQQTIFGGTTLLVPTTGVPVLHLDHHTMNVPSSQEIIPVTGTLNSSHGRRFSFLFIIIFAVVFLFVVVLVLVLVKRKLSHPKPLSASTMGPKINRFSPDLLDGMLKLKQSLTSFSFNKLKLATQSFSESSSIGKSVYKGRIADGSFVAIKDMNSMESANRVVNILTTINHFNVVKIEGYCFNMDKSYLVYEYTENGSLRDCLSESKTRKQMIWGKRVKIAFDVAEGLHYIHYCTKPKYVHQNISTGNILITADWRAKISGFNLSTPVISTAEMEEGGGDWPESVVVVETTVDVYAYGVVLVELLTGKEAATGRKLLDGVEFLADCGGSSECLENFKVFMDGDLEGEYGLGDAMCLALLAKCCIQEDPQYRPTMNDVLKTLSRIL